MSQTLAAIWLKAVYSVHMDTFIYHIPTKSLSLTYINSYNWNLWKKDVRFNG